MSEISAISRAISDVLTGAYKKKRLSQEDVAREAEMSVVTLQKKLKGNAPITATDLVLISVAIGVDPAEVLNEARRDVAMSEPSRSVEPADNVTYLGYVVPPLNAAADTSERVPPKN